MAADAAIDVSLREGHAWRSGHACRALSALMGQLLLHNYRAISAQTIRALGLDPAARRMNGNVFRRDDGNMVSIKDYRTINKALAMELVVSAILTHLDNPEEVRSPCVLSDDGAPKSFAPAMHEDIRASYGGGMRMFVEVSAKRDISAEFYHTQVTQGFAHAEEECEENPGGPIYVLVINGGSIDSNPKLRRVYDAAVKIPRTGDIRLLPINALEFAQLVRDLADLPGGRGFDFDSQTFGAALDHVWDRAKSGGGGSEPGWMREALFEALSRGPTMNVGVRYGHQGPADASSPSFGH